MSCDLYNVKGGGCHVTFTMSRAVDVMLSLWKDYGKV